MSTAEIKIFWRLKNLPRDGVSLDHCSILHCAEKTENYYIRLQNAEKTAKYCKGCKILQTLQKTSKFFTILQKTAKYYDLMQSRNM